MAVAKLTFTERLIRLRKHRGLTQKAMAQRLGYSIGYLNDLEHERRAPTILLLDRIRSEFGLSAYQWKVWNLAGARWWGWEV